MGARTVRAECDLLGPAKTPKWPKRLCQANEASRCLGARHWRFRLVIANSPKRLSPCTLNALGDMLATSLKRLFRLAYCLGRAAIAQVM